MVLSIRFCWYWFYPSLFIYNHSYTCFIGMWQSLKFLNHLQKQKSLSHSDSSKKNGVQTSSVTEWETLFLKWHNMACSLWYVRFLGTVYKLWTAAPVHHIRKPSMAFITDSRYELWKIITLYDHFNFLYRHEVMRERNWFHWLLGWTANLYTLLYIREIHFSIRRTCEYFFREEIFL